jgi:hypothetical protein
MSVFGIILFFLPKTSRPSSCRSQELPLGMSQRHSGRKRNKPPSRIVRIEKIDRIGVFRRQHAYGIGEVLPGAIRRDAPEVIELTNYIRNREAEDHSKNSCAAHPPAGITARDPFPWI